MPRANIAELFLSMGDLWKPKFKDLVVSIGQWSPSTCIIADGSKELGIPVICFKPQNCKLISSKRFLLTMVQIGETNGSPNHFHSRFGESLPAPRPPQHLQNRRPPKPNFPILHHPHNISHDPSLRPHPPHFPKSRSPHNRQTGHNLPHNITPLGLSTPPQGPNHPPPSTVRFQKLDSTGQILPYVARFSAVPICRLREFRKFGEVDT
ncbi:7-deoxyloganetic acid glucosyltransferase [Actinidia chinensis var. chinensis]|uniref:7-deoxyloganetic acid glucosyltransferase n=1 Tax=Actinidia chinensis var. chinensis TaxID=1590841 RepID=A0A2R6RX43_ACTCC|nr:7-deoxyloganetic acid glucosyltransferase [Actinidia chinensis var. chinensis]